MLGKVSGLLMLKQRLIELLAQAASEAVRLFEKDSTLDKPEHRLLAKELARVWQQDAAEWN